MPEYGEYRSMIYKMAYSRAARDRRVDAEELASCGNLAYCEAASSWDPSRASFSTHLWWRLRDRMGKACRRLARDSRALAPLEEAADMVGGTRPEAGCAFRAGLDGLGSEAREVCALVLGSGLEVCDLTLQSVQVTRDNIRRYLRSEGWAREAINAAFGEIQAMLRSL